MSLRGLVATACLLTGIVPSAGVIGQDKKPSAKKLVRIGAVAHKPSIVTVFKNLKTYLNRNGFPSDYVLYSNHEALVQALQRGEIEVAWTPPVAHAKFHLRSGGASQALVMRDVDQDLRVTLVARAEAKVKALHGIEGKRLILGSSGNAEGALLPKFYLKESGVDLEKVKIVSLDKERDAKGRSANSSAHVLKALAENRGDAAVVLESTWQQSKEFRAKNPMIRQVWVSPPFSHCTFTAPQSFDSNLASQFTRLMTNMDPKDPLIAELMRIENTAKFLPGNSTGFSALYKALEQKEK